MNDLAISANRHKLCRATSGRTTTLEKATMIRNERGFTLLDMLFVCGLIGVLSCMALPRLLLAKQAAYQSSAIASLRSINSAQLTFALTCGGGFYAPDLTALAAPPPGSTDAFISPDLGVANVVIKSQY